MSYIYIYIQFARVIEKLKLIANAVLKTKCSKRYNFSNTPHFLF